MSEVIVNQLKEVFNKLNKKLKENEGSVYKLIKDGEALKSDLENLYNIIKVFIEENREKFKKQEEKSEKQLEIKLNALELSLNNLLISIQEEIEKIKNDSNEKIKDILEDIENIKKLIDKLKFQISNIKVLGIVPPTNVKADYVSSGEFGKNSTPGEYIFSSPLIISNQLKITSGNPGNGKVLTSDDQGNVSWKIPPIIGSISSGQIAFGTSSNTIGGNENLFWDNTNKRLGIGTYTPNSRLHVVGDIRHSGNLISQGTNYAFTWMSFDEDQGGNSLFLGSGGLTVIGGGESASQVRGNIPTNDERLVLSSDKTGTSIAHHFITNLQNGWTNKIDAMVILGNGNVGIGVITPEEKLDIGGGIIVRGSGSTNRGIRRSDTSWSLDLYSGYDSTTGAALILSAQDRGGAGMGGRIELIYGGNSVSPGSSNSFLSISSRDSNGLNERLRITSTGNVGIGTTTPSYKLDVNGDTRVTNNLIVNGSIGIGTVNTQSKLDVSGIITSDSLVQISGLWDVARGKSATITSGVLYGGGPTYRNNGSQWHVTSVPASMTVDLGSNIDAITYITFGTNWQDGYQFIPKSYTIEYSTDNINWTTLVSVSNNTNPRVKHHVGWIMARYIKLTVSEFQPNQSEIKIAGFQVLSRAIHAMGAQDPWVVSGSNLYPAITGNVGIGTTSPNYKLTIYGSDISLRIYNTNSGVTYDGLFFRGPIWQVGNEKTGFISCQNNKGLDILTFTTSGSANNGRIKIGSNNSGIRFYFSNQNISTPDDSSYWNEVFTILPSGYVGVGTTSPNSPLHIEKSVNIAGDNTHLRVKQGPSGLYGAKISIDATALSGGRVWELFSSAGTAAEGQGKFIIIDRTSSSSRLTIDTSGNVGIGTTSPTAKLDIDSDTIRLRNTKTPPTSGSSGNKGDIAWDSDYLYVCVDTNTWKRIPLQTW